MKKSVFVVFLFVLSISVDAQSIQTVHKNYNALANYDESKVPAYRLPNPLICLDGTLVTTKKQWERKRRPELLQEITRDMYGLVPQSKVPFKYMVDREDAHALNGKAVRKEITIHLTDVSAGPVMHLQLYLPKNTSGKVPVFLGMSFTPNYTIADDSDARLDPWPAYLKGIAPQRGSAANAWQLEMILAHGYGLATFWYNEVELDDSKNNFKIGIHPYYYRRGQTKPDSDQWGAVAAWAWAASRAMDYLEKDRDVDAHRVAIIGHSRLGKAALWAGAVDTRFALVFPVNSGCCGAALSRRCFGETVECVNVRFPHWFCENYKQFNARENEMPFDQHEVVSLIAPRPVYIASASEDNWSDQKGEFLGGKYAEPVYALYGEQGIGIDEMPPVDVPYNKGYVAYHIRKGPHAVLTYDWDQFLSYADRFFNR